MGTHGVPAIRDIADIRAIEARPYTDFMPHSCVLQGLEHAVHLHANRTALTYIQSADLEQPALRWTHAEFVKTVRQAARLFTGLAGDAQARVAMLLPAIPQAYFTLWGAETAGIACPINYLLGEEHIADLINAANINILVALGPNAELDIWAKVPGLMQRCPSLKHVLAVGGAPAGSGAQDFDLSLAAMSGEPLSAHHGDGGGLAALFHTGGTTGQPKLAQHTHANQLHAAWGAACMYGASEKDVVLNGFPLFHVAGSFVYGLSTLLAGGEVVLPTLLGMRNTAFTKSYWKFVERHRITLLAAVPTIISTLMTIEKDGEDLASVRCLLTGGSPLPTELADAFEQRMGIGVRNILGMTECAGVIAIEPIAAPRMAGSVGLPLPFTEVQVSAEEGILRLRGPNVGPGYTNAASNEGVFSAEGWLVTGDIGHIDATGHVFVTGRAKDVIIRSSHNIDPAVIEDALLRHPAVLLAAAVGAPDEYAGEIPVAYVSLRPGCAADAAELSAFAQQHIPERPACPKAIHILPALPVTAIGKLFKPELRVMATQAVMEEQLQKTGLHASARVHVAIEGREQVVRFTISEAAAMPALRAMMQGFALKYHIDPVTRPLQAQTA